MVIMTPGLVTFNPKNLANLVAWFDAANPSNNGTWPSNGAALTTWVDVSGTGNNGTQVNNPTFNVNIQNHLPGILFNGTNQTYNIAQSTTLDLTSGSTIFIVGSQSSNVLGYALAKRVSGGSDFWQAGVWYPSTGVTWGTTLGTVSSSTSTSLNTAYLWGWNISSSHTLMYQNGTQVYTDNTNRVPTASQSGTTNIGCTAGTANFWTGYLNEIILYNTNLTTSQSALVNDYLRRKWALY